MNKTDNYLSAKPKHQQQSLDRTYNFSRAENNNTDLKFSDCNQSRLIEISGIG